MSENIEYFKWETEDGKKIELAGLNELTGSVFEEAGNATNPHKMNFILLKAASKDDDDYRAILSMKQKDIQKLIMAWNVFEDK